MEKKMILLHCCGDPEATMGVHSSIPYGQPASNREAAGGIEEEDTRRVSKRHTLSLEILNPRPLNS